MDPGQKPSDVFGTAPLLNPDMETGSPSPSASVAQEQEPRRTNYRTANGK
jgi:hypothetical protein